MSELFEKSLATNMCRVHVKDDIFFLNTAAIFHHYEKRNSAKSEDA